MSYVFVDFFQRVSPVLFEEQLNARKLIIIFKKTEKIYSGKITTMISFDRMVFTAFVIRDDTRIISKKKMESGGFHGIKQNIIDWRMYGYRFDFTGGREIYVNFF